MIANQTGSTFRLRGLLSRDGVVGYLFVAPQLVGYLLFVLTPLIAIFIFSFQDFNLLMGTRSWNGIANYREMFLTDPLFLKTLGNSIVFTLGVVPLNIVMSLGLALMLTQRDLPNPLLFRTIFFAPVITSAIAWAIIWKFILDGDNALINQMLSLVGVSGPRWLREPGWAMFSVIFVRVIKNLGLNLVILIGALMNIPRQYLEASQIDGASPIQTFFRITMPMLAPTVLMVMIITLIGSLKVFDHILMLTAGGPNNATTVLVYYVYYQAFQFGEPGSASVGAIMLFLFAMVFTLLQWSMRRRFSYLEE